MRHTITVLVENEFGVLTRVAGLFSARGYNIETLNVAPLQDKSISRMTLVTRGDEHTIEQIKKQLNKLIPVIKVEDISHAVHLERGMLMVKVKKLMMSVYWSINTNEKIGDSRQDRVFQSIYCVVGRICRFTGRSTIG